MSWQQLSKYGLLLLEIMKVGQSFNVSSKCWSNRLLGGPAKERKTKRFLCCRLESNGLSSFRNRQLTAPQRRKCFLEYKGETHFSTGCTDETAGVGWTPSKGDFHDPGHEERTSDKWEAGTYSSLMSSDLIWSEIWLSPMSMLAVEKVNRGFLNLGCPLWR